MKSNPDSTPIWRRRYARAWAVFGVGGLLTGVAYSSGFATSSSGTPTNGNADAVFGDVPANLSSLYQGNIAAVDPLDIQFNGTWGEIAANTELFDVTLDNDAYSRALTGTYFVDVFPTNWAQLGYVQGAQSPIYSHLVLELTQFNTTCAAATTDAFATPITTKVLNIDSIDARVTFTGLVPGVTHYCIGIHAATAVNQANQTVATFVQRPDPTVTPGATPRLMAVVNRSA
jgi:hypothetical protein